MLWLQVFGSRVRVDAVSKVAELELAEKEKMKDKVEKILKHGCNVFINRLVKSCLWLWKSQFQSNCFRKTLCFGNDYNNFFFLIFSRGLRLLKILLVMWVFVLQTAYLQLSRTVICRCWSDGHWACRLWGCGAASFSHWWDHTVWLLKHLCSLFQT